MRIPPLILALLLAALASPAPASSQQKVDIRRSATPTVNVRLSGMFSSLRVIAWANDSIALTGVVSAGNRLEGGPLNFTGPVAGMKFFIEGTTDANVAANKLELRVPRNARVWVKTGSADIDVEGVGGGLDLNIIGGSIRVQGKPRELLVESMDGSVWFKGFSDYARLKTATGNITLEGGGDDLSLTTVSGTIQAANGERSLQRARFESVTGPITFAGLPTRGADLRFDTHSGAIEVRLPRPANVEIDAATMTGAIENVWSDRRPIAGREGRGMELAFSSGMSGARVQVRSFKGNVRLTTK
jgi:DUF4097 and DUF4098 domain-containing protein YvlB